VVVGLELVVVDGLEPLVVDVATFRASAGSCPVIRTTAISDQTAKNRATEHPMARLRIRRTRARRISLIRMASEEVMTGSMRAARSNRVWTA
jgi:hypothetical protein